METMENQQTPQHEVAYKYLPTHGAIDNDNSTQSY